METEPNQKINNQLSCKECGAVLKFAPGTRAIKCDYCGTENEIEQVSVKEERAAVEEIPFEEFLRRGVESSDKQVVATVKCGGCGATTSLKPNVVSDECAFCGTSLVISGGGSESTLIRPKSLLPFNVSQKDGMEMFKKWIDDLWFAPNDLKSRTRNSEKLKGMYIPYWTYDANTYSDYSGQRGDDYTVSETYTDSDGNTQTRQVTHTRWTSVSGAVNVDFDDVLVVASQSLPHEYSQALEPWDLENLTPYNDKFLSGFQTEAYQVDVKTGFEAAKKIMDDEIRNQVRHDIGGDHQTIDRLHTQHDDITFKHILLPIWISAYMYGEKVYRFLINGRTGEVQGERPYSWIKITLAVLGGLSILALLFFLFQGK